MRERGHCRALTKNISLLTGWYGGVSEALLVYAHLTLLRKIQELLHKGIIHMNPIDTKENVADLFTKPLSNEQFWYLSHQATGFNDATGPYAGIIAVAAPKWIKALIRGSASLGEDAEDEPKDSAMISAMINYCDYMNETIHPCDCSMLNPHL
jgi:hypothetical protein